MTTGRRTVGFTRMDQGTAEDYALLQRAAAEANEDLVEKVLSMLDQLKSVQRGYRVNRYVHSLQSATLASDDGADEETIVAALLHDIGDSVAPDNHSALAASVLQPYVSEKTSWIVQHHGLFQGYYFWHHYGMDRNAREAYRDHPHYQDCIDWCDKYDQRAFDPAFSPRPLGFFEPMVRRIFSRKPWEASGLELSGPGVVPAD